LSKEEQKRMYAEMSEENEEIKKALAELEGAIEEEE
jgi:hypothetical protein